MIFHLEDEHDESATLVIQGISDEDEIEVSAGATSAYSFLAKLPMYDREIAELIETLSKRLAA